jgi:N-acylglucosamine 2-epimerase
MTPATVVPLANSNARFPREWRALADRYQPLAKTALAESIVPFWARTLDDARGGVFNCWDNTGTQLVSRDKFTWSQGRFLWLWSRLAVLARRGLLTGDAPGLLGHAEKTMHFLRQHAFLDDGRCAFRLSEDGVVKETFAGSGPAPSIYADCFVVMGFAEYARASGERGSLDAAWQLFEQIERRIEAGGFPTHPEPIPAGYDAHAIAMITLNLTLVLHEACAELRDARLGAAQTRSVAAAGRIFHQFMQSDGRIVEMRPRSAGMEETLLSRHLNPGHALEGLWMLLTVAQHERRADWLARAQAAVRYALERGWDEERGGLLHYVDRDGGVPRGQPGKSQYEKAVRDTWDAKLWWIHSEALFTTALTYQLTGDEATRGWFERVWEYAFRVFPHPNPAVGEWIQIRDRRGAPLERVVALPVKDPYHIARNLIQVLELFSTPVSTL